MLLPETRLESRQLPLRFAVFQQQPLPESSLLPQAYADGFVETGAGDVVEDGHLLGASYIAGDGAPPFAGLYGDVGHERFQVLILRT